MKKINGIKGVLLSSIFAVSSAHAAGFALIEQSASGMGNAFAGGAAAAEDASTVYFNPAGMTYIQGTQVVGAVHFIKPSAEFTNNGSTLGLGVGNGGDAGDLAYVPNLYFVTDMTPSVKFGIGLNSPFGLKTQYDSTWIGRFQAIKSSLETININPSVAYKINDQLSVGAGVSAMWIQAELSKQASASSVVTIKGDDVDVGYNFGAIYQITPDTRFGIAYRSKMNERLEGQASFTGALAFASGPVTAKVILPDNFSASIFSKLDDKWDLMGDITWTQWSRFKTLNIIRDPSGAPLSVNPENWHNTLRYSLGASYHFNDDLKLRAGLAYDEEAIDDQFRTARIPGNDRKWLSLGASYQVSTAGKVDVGYAHLFISDAPINHIESGPPASTLKGSFAGDVNMLSFQYTHSF
jgi:long-chain fatty acid transport protein